MSYKIVEDSAKTATEIYEEVGKQVPLNPEKLKEELKALLELRNQKWIPLKVALTELDGMEMHGWRDLDEVNDQINALLDKLTIDTNSPNWPIIKQLKCVVCGIHDCSTKNSPDVDECLLDFGKSATNNDKETKKAEP